MATAFKIKVSQAQEVANYCSKEIGPQKFYLHTGRVGGGNWEIRKLTNDTSEVIINDDKLATLIMLKWS